MAMSRATVVVCDDAREARVLLRSLLRYDPSIEIVGEASDGLEAIEAVGHYRPNVVLLDLAMPVMDGLEALPEIGRISPDSKVVVVSGFEADAMEEEVLALGATAYVQKGASRDELLNAVWRALDRDSGEGDRPDTSSGEPVPPDEGRLALTRVFEEAATGMTIGSLDGRYLRVNQAFSEMVGHSAEWLLGRTFMETTHPDDRAADTAAMPALIAGDVPRFVTQKRYIHSSGSDVWVLLTVCVSRDHDGRPLHFLSHMQDITAHKKTEEELRTAKQLTESVIESSLDGIAAYDREARYTIWNPAMERMTGVVKDQVIGKTVYEVFPHVRETEGERLFLSPLQGKSESVERKAFNVPATGRTGYYAGRWSPLFDATGHIEGGLMVAHDVTDRLRAEEHLERFFNQNLDMLCIAGFDGYFKRLNPVWERVLGWSTEELLAEPFVSFVHPDDRESTTHEAAKLAEGDHITILFENRYRCKDGTYKWLQWMSSTSADHRLIFATARDVTKSKEDAQEMARLTAELERSNTELLQFARVASHDLKEPLRTVRSFIELLRDRYAEKLDDDGKEFIAFAIDGSTRMERLITDLLAYARVGAESKPTQVVDMSVAVDEAIESLATLISDRGAAVTRDDLPTVVGDPSQMSQLFQNLIGNAIKYCENAPRVHVSGTLEIETATFSVSDNGLGIDAANLDRVFEVFKRCHSRARFDGTGVGLSICKKIVERHGGKIWVCSQPGTGSTFSFTLPVQGPNPGQNVRSRATIDA
jgi:PAS domain S-box-containing protein